MPELLIKLCFGIFLLLVSTKYLVKFAEKLSSRLKISPLIVGMTIVALGTSLPELSVSSIALTRNDTGLAIGNIIGSNIVNIFLVFPLGILVGKLRVGTTKTQRNAIVLLLVTFLFILIQFIPAFNFSPGLLLIGLAIIITFAEYKWAVFGRTHEDLVKMKNLTKEKLNLWKWLIFIASIVGIVVGGYFTVISTEEISLITGYSTTILGLSLTAIATSLPELLATIFSQEEHEEKLTIGNIIGSNIYNLLFIGGLIIHYSPKINVKLTDWFILSFATVLFVLVLRNYKGEKIPKRIGLVFLLLFVAYLFVLSAVG